MNMSCARLVWLPLITIVASLALVLGGFGCEKDNSNSGGGNSNGGGSSGNCAENANRIQANMSSAQVIDIMGSPNSSHTVLGETQMIWQCGSNTVLVDFQPGDRVYMVLANDNILVLRDSYN